MTALYLIVKIITAVIRMYAGADYRIEQDDEHELLLGGGGAGTVALVGLDEGLSPAWYDSFLPVLHNRAKCSQLLVIALKLNFPSLSFALLMTSNGWLH